MERWKDMFYNKNDIFLALVILLIAGFVIYDRVEAIMDYPQALAMEQDQNAAPAEEQSPPAAETSAPPEAKPADEPAKEDVPDQTAEQPEAEQPQQPAQSPPAQVTKVTIEIPSGTTEATVGRMLVDKGFISDKSSFVQALEAAGKTGKVQAGKFSIPSDATMEQIIDIFTN